MTGLPANIVKVFPMFQWHLFKVYTGGKKWTIRSKVSFLRKFDNYRLQQRVANITPDTEFSSLEIPLK